MITCTYCLNPVDFGQTPVVETAGEVICKECLLKLECCYACPKCTMEPEVLSVGPEDRSYCDTCYSDLCWICDGCVGVFLQSIRTRTHTRGGSVVCTTCRRQNYYRCYRCTEWDYADERCEVNGDSWCMECRDNYASCCEVCDNWYTGDRCCEPGKALEVDYVPYSWTPQSRHFLKANKDHVPQEYFGWELELELPDSARRRESISSLVRAHPSWWVVKEDGSLPENGVEIVSMPMTWRWLREHKKDLSAFLGDLAREACETTSVCGLHVHISREGIGRTQLYRMMHMLCTYTTFTTAFSNRPTTQLNQYASPRMDKHHRYEMCRWFHNRGYRYTAINLPDTKPTVEFRLFASTLDPHEFFKSLEFCHALKHFAAMQPMQDCKPRLFQQWVATRQRVYPELHRGLSELRPEAFASVP